MIEFVKGLLEHVGSILDPITLVRSIPAGMEIEGLRESLIKIFYDHEIQVCPPLFCGVGRLMV
jgi:vacuolar protein sorting-associated protein 41